MNAFIIKVALWLLSKTDHRFVSRPNSVLVDQATEFYHQMKDKPEGWEWKQKQAIRGMINSFPWEPIRNLNLAIEIAVQECSGLK